MEQAYPLSFRRQRIAGVIFYVLWLFVWAVIVTALSVLAWLPHDSGELPI
jgi:hypothetical protein